MKKLAIDIFLRLTFSKWIRQAFPVSIAFIISRFFCKHNYLWVRNVYGDEIYVTGKFKRSWWKCNKCGKWQSKEQLYTEGRS